MLPVRHFFTGAPGSRWSGVAQDIEANGFYDTSDRTPERTYTHNEFSGHVGAYFGTGMEFPASLDPEVLDAPYTGIGTRLHKSHEWAYMLDDIVEQYPDCWITLLYREDYKCLTWWLQAGGFDITYPNYDMYQNESVMLSMIGAQNHHILEFAHKHKLTWHHVDSHADVLKATWKADAN